MAIRDPSGTSRHSRAQLAAAPARASRAHAWAARTTASTSIAPTDKAPPPLPFPKHDTTRAKASSVATLLVAPLLLVAALLAPGARAYTPADVAAAKARAATPVRADRPVPFSAIDPAVVDLAAMTAQAAAHDAAHGGTDCRALQVHRQDEPVRNPPTRSHQPQPGTRGPRALAPSPPAQHDSVRVLAPADARARAAARGRARGGAAAAACLAKRGGSLPSLNHRLQRHVSRPSLKAEREPVPLPQSAIAIHMSARPHGWAPATRWLLWQGAALAIVLKAEGK